MTERCTFSDRSGGIRPTLNRCITVSGHLDVLSGPTLADVVADQLAAQERGQVRLELADVSFIDCAGIGILVQIISSAREQGRQVMIVSSSRAVDRLASLTGLQHLLPIDGRISDRAADVEPAALQRPAA